MNRESLIDFSKYDINKDGTIVSKWFGHTMKGAEWNGYLTVNLKTVDSQHLFFKYHRVIWYYFNGEIPEGYEIDHINGDRADNRLENLRIVTHTENVNNPLTIERIKKARSKEKNPFFGKHHSEETKKKMSERAKTIVRERNSLGQFI